MSMNLLQLLFFIVFLSLLGIFLFAWRNVGIRGAVGVMAVMGAALVWLVGAYSEIISESHAAMLFWRNATQLSVCFLPISMLFFALEFTETSRRTKVVWLSSTLAVALMALVLLWSDSHHHIMRTTTEIKKTPLGTLLKVYPTNFGLILMSYVTASHLMAEIVLLTFARNAPATMAKQARICAFGLSFPIIYILIKSFFPIRLFLYIPTPLFFSPWHSPSALPFFVIN